MFTWFNNLKIRNKLIGAFLVMIGLTIVVSIVALVSQNNARTTVNQLLDKDVYFAELSLQSDVAMLTARRREKDYLLRYKELGFEEARATYVTGVQNQVAIIHGYMAELKNLAPSEEDIAQIEMMDQAITEYETTFLAAVEVIEQRGHVDTGLEGQFRDKVHEIEDVVEAQGLDSLMIDMLMMRRHEKDYLLRGEQKYIDRLHERVAQFKANVAATNLPPAEQETLTTLANEYQTLFDQLVEADAELADSIETYRAAVHTLEPILDTFYQEALQDQEKAKVDMQRTTQAAILTVIGVSVAAAIVGLLVAFFLSRNIANAVKAVARAADGIAEGDLDQIVEVTSEDELGDMMAAFQRMIAYMQLMAGAAGRLAQGDVAVEVTPQSQKDVLGNAFRQMITYQQQMAQAAGYLAGGDLTAKVAPLSERDALGNAFRQMIGNLGNLIGQAQQSADQVAGASRQLNTATEQASQASQQVATTIQQVAEGTIQQTQSVAEVTTNVEQMARAANGIATGAQEQARGIQETSNLIDEMTNLVDQVGQVTGTVTEASNKVTQAARHGATSVEQTGQGMEKIRARTTSAVERVKEMGDRSKEIGRIVETIDDIADKTDMLALNAAVEAARAGEHGRGFAVVADQVRKLSEDSKSATRDIGGLIERVQETVNEAVAAIESAAAEVDNGTRLAGDTTQSLQDILQAAEGAADMAVQISRAVAQLKQKSKSVTAAVESVSTVVEENTAAAEEMAANSQGVTEAMEGVASIAEENSASTEEVSASAEEMAAQVEEIVASAEELSALAEDLRIATAQFRLNEKAD
jgi:methyl-accepting chemotaxis protein